ncbi:hypothetical protein [Isoptericola sp. AK164]|uniref:hypothetical protein n=1 Tax=Isoptericola sp. AK164 TaxID=3024246 RepID=UPI00241878DF|nr:hypothetical protein [Isoptericola sp. AK164]
MAKIVGAMAVVGLLGTSGAHAVSASVTGSYAVGTASYVSSNDNRADSKFTKTIYLEASGYQGSLTNHSGAYTVVDRAADDVTHVKACISRTLLPM